MPASKSRADRPGTVPQGSLVLTTGFVIVDANAAYLRARRTELPAIAGRLLFDVFPDNSEVSRPAP